MNVYPHLFLIFFRIGIFGFGGGYAMLPLIFQSVQDFGVMTAAEFSNLVALSQVTPGPVAVNAATFVGFNYAGLAGAASATLGVALPSFLLVFLVSHFLEKFKGNKGIQAAFSGIRPATVGLIASAAIFIGQSALVQSAVQISTSSAQAFLIDLVGSVNLLPCAIFLCTIVLVGKFKMSPIAITILMGAIGAFICG